MIVTGANGRLLWLAIALLVGACGERQVSTTSTATQPEPAEGAPAQAPPTAEPGTEGPRAPAKVASVRELLEGVRDGKIAPGELSVSFSSRGDPAFGYSSVTVATDGFTDTLRISAEGAHHFKRNIMRAQGTITPAQHRQLVEVLLSIEAWEQRDEERTILRGENRSILEVSGAGQSSTIWELPPEPGETPPEPRIERVTDLLNAWAPELPWGQPPSE
jgi:hypothetical protein